MSNGDMWPEKSEVINIKLVTHVSKKYVRLYDGQVFWRKRIRNGVSDDK